MNTAGKSPSYRRRRTERTASDDPRLFLCFHLSGCFTVLLALASEMNTVVKPSSKRRHCEKPNEYGKRSQAVTPKACPG